MYVAYAMASGFVGLGIVPLLSGIAAHIYSRLRQRPPVGGLVLHVVGPGRGWGYSHFPSGRFTDLARCLNEKGWFFPTVSEKAGSTSMSGDTKIALTFDDGFSCFYENVLPILQRLQIRATLFPVAGWIGKSSTWDVFPAHGHCTKSQLREIADLGHEIGSHSLSHPDLCLLDDTELRREVGESRALIEDVIGKPVTSISFPFGSWNGRVWRTCRAQGYAAAAIYRGHRFALPGMVAVTGAYAFDSVGDVVARLRGLPVSGNAVVRGRIMSHFAKGAPLWKYRREYDPLRRHSR